MAAVDYATRERLPELWKQIDNTHYSYLETDDCPEKLDQRKKLEGYITDFLCLVPHENKFILQATRDVFTRSALSNCDFSGYRLARGWAAIARYAGNLLSQPWRKEYCTIRLYSGFFKHEVEGSGLIGAVAMLTAMGYKAVDSSKPSIDTMVLDGPVCPDLVSAVSRDSLIAYVECQLMTQIWEELSLRGNKCSWLDVFHCRKNYVGNVDQAVATIVHLQRGTDDLYCNVKFPHVNTVSNIKQSAIQKPLHINNDMQFNGIQSQMNNHMQQSQHGLIQTHTNGMHLDNSAKYPLKYHNATPHANHMLVNNGDPSLYCHTVNHIPTPVAQINVIPRNNYDMNHMYMPNSYQMNQCRLSHNYQRNPMMDHPYILQPLPYNPTPMMNGYHCSAINQPPYCAPPVTTAQLIDIESPSYMESNSCHTMPTSPPHDRSQYPDQFNTNHVTKQNVSNRRTDDCIDGQDNLRRNSAPRSSTSYLSDKTIHTLPRSDTQPSLSKALDDGKGTYESWNYVYQNLESRGLKKNFDDQDNSYSNTYERDSRSQKKINDVDQRRTYQNTGVEDSFNYLSLGKQLNEDSFKKSKEIKDDDTGARLKHKNSTRTTKHNTKKLNDDRAYLFNGSHNSVADNMPTKISDKTLLISKEDTKAKKDIDKEVFMNKNGVSGENKKLNRHHNSDSFRHEHNNHSSANKKSQDTHAIAASSNQTHDVPESVNQTLKNRLVVSLDASDKHHVVRDGKSDKRASANQWECGACTYLNHVSKSVCEICGKSKQVGVEAQPLMSGGKECPLCTLVNVKEAKLCEACGTSLKDSPTYI